MIFDHKMQKKVKSKVPTLRKIGPKKDKSYDARVDDSLEDSR